MSSHQVSDLKRAVLLALLLSIASAAGADTVYLKNGTSLTVDRARDKGDHIEYVMGGTTYTLPKSQVLRIESGKPGVSIGPVVSTRAVPPPGDSVSTISSSSASSSKHEQIAITVPAEPPEVAASRAAIREEITNLGRVDNVALGKIEARGDARITAGAYLEAGRIETERGDFEKARQYLQHGLRVAPDNRALLAWDAAVLLRLKRYSDATTEAEHAVRLSPDSPDLYRLLGTAYYESEKPNDAIKAWQRAYKLRPDPAVQELIAKAQRESNVEENFNQQETWHFSLRFDGQRTSLGLQRDLLHTLEDQYRELSRELDFAPRENITVVLYTNRAFFDVTQSPSWAGGVYDGKLRIPVEGVTAVTPELQRVMKHELTHSFISYMTNNRAPAWVQEGIAQMLEPRALGQYGPVMSHAFQQHKQAPMRVLEGTFAQYSSSQAMVAYVESLAAAEYLRSTIGMSGIQKILERIGSGDSPEAALKAVNRTSYAQFEDEMRTWLAGQYGT
jgi:tetratricopeptide (TPR) repeat protein